MKTVMGKQRLSALSKECIKNKGACCEQRTKPVFTPSEVETLIDSNNSDYFEKHGNTAVPKGICGFFDSPLCAVYEKRPVDCRTYPVSVKLDNGVLYFVIDMKCPAVRKGIVTYQFISRAKTAWIKNLPGIEWLKEYSKEECAENHEWIPVEDYKPSVL